MASKQAATPEQAKRQFQSEEQREAQNGKGGKRKWKRMPRKRFRFWRPEEGDSLVCTILSREERDGKFGRRPAYIARVEEGGQDSKGEYDPGDLLAINEVATLRDLQQLVGSGVCMLTLAGHDGKVKLFDVDVEE